ncbi:hypothetical protein AN639_08855 [Candidatus Epulonipiscium fishelsonii]|uniref:Uncharacterized protein n=1 Tax=Candidatus Epulonipiscium fishelsonii TaxID=77094 RepID=A0ACC8XDC0_9FIRM|nr:hypothetical protein AN639_08855 [Epulopiscium sp. SCG-B05WGA-EpuloA1]ONI40956.1 hypothetical protein AN396_04140 [Epulopiscium sp. SCG-B11WGA-EpuloA1]
MKKHKIIEVLEGSIAEEIEIEAGDFLLSINDEAIQDVFDYKFLLADEFIEVLIQKHHGEEWLLEIDKDYEDDLGLIFETELMDDLIRCKNKCKFCFIDQLPPNMRKTVYFKDDDWRMSFLNGNYITLTNMSEQDLYRLEKYHLSPLNISIHVTDSEVRKELLNNNTAGDIIPQLKRLIEAGIEINGQIVLCKGINDGELLDKTIRDLSQFIPHILSLTIVPVGISKFRQNLTKLEAFDKKSAKIVVEIVEKWQDYYLKKMGTRFVFVADEFYILSEKDPLKYEEYEGFHVLDNGVGMITKFRYELIQALKEFSPSLIKKEVITVTGVITRDFMSQNIKLVNEKLPNISIKVYTIINEFFGENITVTGLLTGQDIINQLKDKNIKDKTMLLPANMLKSVSKVFLDDYTVDDIERELQCKVVVVSNEGKEWLDAILSTEEKI